MYTTNVPYRTREDSQASRNGRLQVTNPDDPSQTVPLRYRKGSHDAHNMRVRLMHPDAFEEWGDRACAMIVWGGSPITVWKRPVDYYVSSAHIATACPSFRTSADTSDIVLAGFDTKTVELALDIIHGQTAYLVDRCLSLIELVELAGLTQTLNCRDIMTFHITSWFKAWEIGSRLITSPDWNDHNMVMNLLDLLWMFPTLPNANSLFQTASLHAIKNVDSPMLSMPCRPYSKKLAACINEQRTKLIEQLITPVKCLDRDPRLKCLKCGHTRLCDCSFEFAWARSLGIDFSKPHIVSRPYVWCSYHRLETTIHNNLANAKRYFQLCYTHSRFKPLAEELRKSITPLNLRDFPFETQDRSYRPEIFGYIDGPSARMPQFPSECTWEQARDRKVFPGPHDYKSPYSDE